MPKRWQTRSYTGTKETMTLFTVGLEIWNVGKIWYYNCKVCYSYHSQNKSIKNPDTVIRGNGFKKTNCKCLAAFEEYLET